MKRAKLLTLLLASFLFIGLTSCDKDEDIVGATAKIKVTESGSIKSGISVCMFSEQKGPSTSFFTPFHADKKVITESDGIATFNLQKTFDLEIIDSQTTLYFGVFDDDDTELGRTAMTIEIGETKSATISY